MCGFAGEFVFAGSARADLGAAEAMAGRLAHRGPDETGSYVSDDGRFAVGFRRLAIIDPELSHQPMVAEDGSAALAFNGEIYNFCRLRERLAAEGRAFRTRGDTEVLLAACGTWGERAVEHLEGMFAFAFHDAGAGRLLLARDRLGQKPLWYAVLAERIVFASEAKALLAHPLAPTDVEPRAVAAYLTLGYVPAPHSIWRGMRKLPPASVMTVADSPGQPKRYWHLPDPPADDSPAAVDRVRQALSAAVEKRMVADVPLGALLSGGVDSSIVVALMCRATGGAGGVKTFTAGFEDAAFDERPGAAEVAGHLGTDHRELLVAATGAGELLDALVDQYDEPLADSSALPTYLICRAAREHVRVALVGDGGDEVFGGYDRYRAMHLAERMSPARWLAVAVAARVLGPLAPHDERSRLRRFVRFAKGLNLPPAVQYFTYRRLFSPEQLAGLMERDFAAAAQIDSPAQWFTALYEQGHWEHELHRAQRHDLLTYLPDDLLVKADIASMASSLELRSPMLDHEVVALGLSLPAGGKLRRGRGKAILRDAFGELLPRGVFSRPKRGFGAPIARWLRGELLGPLRQTLLDGRLVGDNWLAREPMRRLIDDHLAGRADHRHRLWALLWLGRWLERRRPP